MRMPDPIIDPARRHRPRARGAAGRLGRARAAGRARDADARRAARVRPARHVRRAASTRSRRSSNARRGDASAREPRPPPRAGRAHDARHRPRRSARSRRRVPRRGPRRRLRARWSPCSTPTWCSRADFGGGARRKLRGAEAVASQALAFSRLDLDVRPALINGAVGAVTLRDGQPFSVGARHGARRQDRRAGLPRRPGAPRPARPDDARRLRRGSYEPKEGHGIHGRRTRRDEGARQRVEGRGTREHEPGRRGTRRAREDRRDA